jgi:hypothetical protein|tara:strand:+ start:214 stop:582 length:369 start_codon:yes stop_codon:yes gene_type:complete
MILRCNKECKLSDGVTDGSLDVDSNDVICNECGEVLGDVSPYAKLALKANGDILRSKNKKAFVFPCNTCEQDVETQFVNGVLVGKGCKNDQVGCQINITEHMVKAIEETQKVLSKADKNDAE